MPYLDSGAQDDVLVFDSTIEFTGGMETYRAPRLIEQNQTASLVNVDLDRDGAAVTRLGSENWGPVFTGDTSTTEIQGLAFYNTNERTDLICVKNAKLWWQNSQTNNVAWTRINPASGTFTTTQTTGDVYFAQLEGKMFFCDGFQDLKYIAPEPSPLIGLGVYDIPQDPIAGWRRPTKMKFLTTHAGRLMGVDSDYPDTIRVSEILDATSPSFGSPPTGGAWNAANDVTVGGDGDAITGLASWTGTRLVVFKRNATYVIECEDPDPANWIIQQIDGAVGCAAHKSIARVGADVYWLSGNGVRTLRRTLSGTENEISEPLSKPISSLTDRIYSGDISKSAGYFYDNRYFLTTPETPLGATSSTIVYNTITKSWSGRWTMPALHWVRYTNAAADHLVFGTSVGFVRRWMGNKQSTAITLSDYTDAGAGYETYVLSREFSFGDFLSDKSPFNIEVEFFNSLSSASIYVIKDSGFASEVFSAIPTTNLGLTLPFVLDASAILSTIATRRRAQSLIGSSQFRGMQILARSQSGKLGLRAFSASAFIDPYKAQR